MKPVMLKGLVTICKPRQFVILGLVLLLSWTTIACGGGSEPDKTAQGNGNLAQTSTSAKSNSAEGATKIADGKYDVQQATYNDGNGEYTLFLLNTPPNTAATFRTAALRLAQLTPEEVTAAQKPYLQVKDGQSALHIPQDFKLEYVHNVVEQAQNPQTGQTEPRVVRQESNFWSPFAGAIAGQVVGNMLFRPQYYVPPMYQQGGGLFGHGGYGNSYNQASSSYRQRYNQAPAVERNRTVYRSTQRSTSGFGSSGSRVNPSSSSNQRSTGRGFGSSSLRSSGSSSGTYRRSPSSGFGSGRSFGSRSFGGRRR
jgi:hypothetical protein